MSTRLYVGNLSYATTVEQLRATFAANGREVRDVYIATDRNTGRPRGFAFVQMASEEDSMHAAKELNGKNLDGRPLVVNEAVERTTEHAEDRVEHPRAQNAPAQRFQQDAERGPLTRERKSTSTSPLRRDRVRKPRDY